MKNLICFEIKKFSHTFSPDLLDEHADLAHIREAFYRAKDMKELFQNIKIKNVMSSLKAINIYGKI